MSNLHVKNNSQSTGRKTSIAVKPCFKTSLHVVNYLHLDDQ